MRVLKQAFIWLLIFIHVFLYGCASTTSRFIPDIHRLENRSSDYPVGIILAQFPPKTGVDFVIKGKGSGASAGAAGGVASCADLLASGGEGAALAFLLCLPIGMAVGAIGGAVTAPSADEADSAEDRIYQKIQPLMGQAKLAESVQNYLSAGQDNIHIIFAYDLQGVKLEDTERVFESAELGNYQTILEVAVLEILFKGPGRKNTPACLHMKARATKWNGITGKKLDEMDTVYYGACHPVNTWIEEKGKKIIADIEYGYQVLTEAIVDELFFVFIPEVNQALLEIDTERKVPYFVLAPNYPILTKDLYEEQIFSKKRKDLISGGGWDFVEISDLEPRFSWEAFPRPFDNFSVHSVEPKNVSYELRVYEGLKKKNKIVLDRKLIYTANNIRQNSYTYPWKLKSCNWYYWTIRARFKLNGIMRTTEWAGTYDTIFISYSPSNLRRDIHSLLTEDVYLYHFYYPFRTPADATNPDCWNQKLD